MSRLPLVCVLWLLQSLSATTGLTLEQQVALEIQTGESGCNAAGASFQYTETIDGARSVRVISTSSCPNHFSACQSAECGGDRISHAKVMPTTYEVPLFPGFARDSDMVDATCSASPVAVALNGVPIMGMADLGATETCISVAQMRAENPNVGKLSLKPCDLDGIGDGVRVCGDAVVKYGKLMDKCGG